MRATLPLVLSLLLAAPVLHAAAPAMPDLTLGAAWAPATAPFAFEYGDRPSATLLASWQFTATTLANDHVTYTYTDPKTHLRITADLRLLPDFPGAVDYVLHLQNDGKHDTPILDNIEPLHLALPNPTSAAATIHHAHGSLARADDFHPIDDRITRGNTLDVQSSSGDSSSGSSLPFFNVQLGNSGLVEAIGWTGNWHARFVSAPDQKSLTLTAGMQQTHLLLHPGEEIRSPRIVLMPWADTAWQDAQNTWRRLLFAHYTPQDSGHPMLGPILFGSWGSDPIADKLRYIDWIHTNAIPVTLYAVDAGWYGASVGAETDPTNPWYKNRGDWFPSPLYYPNGLAPLGEALRAANLGFSLWLEPETSMPAGKIARDHPDWFLHTDRPMFTEGFPSADVLLLNLGNPAALAGITTFVSNLITENHITWFRQDFNIPPERYWQLADAPNRIGITEIRHITGLYQFWDTLLAQHPGLHIDNCASGGRRLDIEMLSRSFLVWRTDYGFADTLAEQAQTEALAPWVPENMGFSTLPSDHPWTAPPPYNTAEALYRMRLGYNTGFGLTPGAAGVQNPAWVTWIKDVLAEYREVQPFFLADFYPLVSPSLAPDTWTASQWNRRDQNDGVVIVLRRPGSPFTSIDLPLQHLHADRQYRVEIRTADTSGPIRTLTGADLAHLTLALPSAPSSALIFYTQLP